MKKFIWIGIIVVVISIFIGLILLQKHRDARPFNHYDFPETIQVVNATDYEKADTICMLLAYEVLGMDTLNMTIANLPVIKTEETEFYAIIQYMPFKPNQFVMLLKGDMSLGKLKTALTHEFVHVGQYVYGDLVMYPKYAVYMGDTVVFKEVGYKDRPFEKDAFNQQGRMNKELNKLLYGTD